MVILQLSKKKKFASKLKLTIQAFTAKKVGLHSLLITPHLTYYTDCTPGDFQQIRGTSLLFKEKKEKEKEKEGILMELHLWSVQLVWL